MGQNLDDFPVWPWPWAEATPPNPAESSLDVTLHFPFTAALRRW